MFQNQNPALRDTLCDNGIWDINMYVVIYKMITTQFLYELTYI